MLDSLDVGSVKVWANFSIGVRGLTILEGL